MKIELKFTLEDIVTYFGSNSIPRVYTDFYWFNQRVYKAIEKISLAAKPNALYFEELGQLSEFRESLANISRYLWNKAVPKADMLSTVELFEKLREYIKELHEKKGCDKKFKIDSEDFELQGIFGVFYQRIENLKRFYTHEKTISILNDQDNKWRMYLFEYLNQKFSSYGRSDTYHCLVS